MLDIFKNGKVLNYTGNPITLLEQRNQKLCYELLKSKIVRKEPISVDLVKEIQKALTIGTYDECSYIKNGERPGELKKHDYVTGSYEVGSAPEIVEDDLNGLITEINEYNGTNILKAATYLHARFEFIHPFADGNGRVGRTIMNNYLMVNNHPPLIVYDEDKCLYYECLQKYDEDEVIQPLYEFFRYEAEKTWADTFATIIA